MLKLIEMSKRYMRILTFYNCGNHIKKKTYHVLSIIARDILKPPTSTVASKFAFSINSRMLKLNSDKHIGNMHLLKGLD